MTDCGAPPRRVTDRSDVSVMRRRDRCPDGDGRVMLRSYSKGDFLCQQN